MGGSEKAVGALVLSGQEETTSGQLPLVQTHSEVPQPMEVLPSALSVQLPTSHSLSDHSSPGDLNRAYRGQGDSRQLLVFLWLRKPPTFYKSKYFLDF